MKRNILSKLVCLTMMAFLSLSAYAQEKIYLVKDNNIVATFGINEVDYLTFNPTGLNTTDDFDVIVGDADYTSVTWNVTPKDPEMYYYTNVYVRDALETEFHNSVEELAKSLYDDMKFLADMLGMPIDDYMAQQVLSKGDADFSNYQLGPDSEYAVVVFGCHPDGTPSTSTYTAVTFSTPAIEKIDLTVKFDIDATYNDVVIKTIPSSPTIRYYIGVEEVGYNIDPQGIINSAIWRGSVTGKTPEEVIAEITEEGETVKKHTLQPEFEYEVFTFAVTPDGYAYSDVSSQTFVSGPVKPSDNTFEINIDEINSRSVTFTVTPSNSDQYSLGIFPKSDVEGLSDEEVIENYIMYNEFVVDWNTREGKATYVRDGFNAETEYVIYVFGYYSGTATTPVTKAEFKTVPTSDPKTWIASFSDITFTESYGYPSAVVNINVNQDDVPYVWNVVAANATPEQIHAALLEDCEFYESLGVNYLDYKAIYGSNEVSFTPDQDWGELKFFAVVLNRNTYEFETEVFFSDTFTMPELPANMPAKVAASSSDKNKIADKKSKTAINGILKLNIEK